MFQANMNRNINKCRNKIDIFKVQIQGEKYQGRSLRNRQISGAQPRENIKLIVGYTGLECRGKVQKQNKS